MTARVASAREQPVIIAVSANLQPSPYCIARRLRDLERHGSSGLLLNDSRSQPEDPPGATSLTRSFTRSHALSFESSAQLNIARSRTRFATLSCYWIAPMCFGFSGALGPIRRPAFQGRRGMMKRSDWRIANLPQGGLPARPILLSFGRACARNGHASKVGKTTLDMMSGGLGLENDPAAQSIKRRLTHTLTFEAAARFPQHAQPVSLRSIFDCSSPTAVRFFRFWPL